MRYLSVCSGIEAATVAWHHLGWTPSGFAEIEPFPSAVLKHHYPDVPNFGDFTKIKESDFDHAIDLIVGGTPCQSFSVAGKRLGLDDPRGNLSLEFVRLCHRLRPTWILWENVPGVFSSGGGEDFATFVQSLDAIGYHVAWRVLDAQYFGVPQRRRRVFLVGHIADWRRSAEVLFEPESMFRDTPPSRKAGEEIADTLSAGFGVRGYSVDGVGAYVPEVSMCINAHGVRLDAESETLIALGRNESPPGNPIVAFTQNATRTATPAFLSEGIQNGNANKTNPTETLRRMFSTITEEAATKWSLGVLVSFFSPEVLQSALHGSEFRQASWGGSWMVNCSLSREEDRSCGAMQSLRECVGEGCSPQGWESLEQLSGELGTYLQKLSQPGTQAEEVMRHLWEASEGIGLLRKTLSKIQEARECNGNKRWGGSSVRRLTVTECEFLQGFPRDYSRIPWRGKAAEQCPDAPRYKAIGNSMAVPVMSWIGERIERIGL